ncbi:hypothetical protein [Mycobacteroides abscessus]|uniref:hypothetical protein n=1 Tax=Mycobacteroides abscessus TaxID=36809 RepID=UPI0009A77AF9|nr:hypothetical protein [Mycobacteroides abscessus]MBN7377783.1 hypothetical protein [Mycobacteroides abscessus subsp. massiliense]PVB28602.1 hypothetical protein DDJ92_21295 [Mycobacteroides abscessus]SKE24869.1 Uncharacterised protein [Mycobacteroides abscessus subsp. massiliense]
MTAGRLTGADPMPVTVLLDEISSSLPLVNVTFNTWFSGAVGTVLTLCELDDLIAQLKAARSAFDEDEHKINEHGEVES